MLRSAAPPLLLFLVLLAVSMAAEFEDVDEHDNPVLTPPGVRRTPRHLALSAPCGPEYEGFCQWGHCSLEPRPEGKRVPTCTCLQGYSGERCSKPDAPVRPDLGDAAKIVKGKSMAQEILEKESRLSCSRSGQGGCDQDKEEEEEVVEQQEGGLPQFELQTKEIPADHIEVRPCEEEDSNPCQNGGHCSVVIIGLKNEEKPDIDTLCECAEGFEGDHCETRTNQSKAA